MRRALSLLLLCSMVLSPIAASAADRDDDETTETTETTSSGGSASRPAESDHDSTAGTFGLGFMGVRVVPATMAGSNPVVITDDGDAILTIESDEVVVPVFGGRYWFSSTVGVELGLGFNVASGSVEREIPNASQPYKSTEVLEPSTHAFIGHLALPLSVFSRKHYGLLLIPELDVGYSSSTIEDFEVSTTGEPLDLQLSGLLIGVGARLGLELSFGFFEVPELSLVASWGLRYESNRRKGKIGDAEAVIGESNFGTSTYDDPWATFAGGLGLYYHF